MTHTFTPATKKLFFSYSYSPSVRSKGLFQIKRLIPIAVALLGIGLAASVQPNGRADKRSNPAGTCGVYHDEMAARMAENGNNAASLWTYYPDMPEERSEQDADGWEDL